MIIIIIGRIEIVNGNTVNNNNSKIIPKWNIISCINNNRNYTYSWNIYTNSNITSKVLCTKNNIHNIFHIINT